MDAVVIGAGPNGLAAAATLARAGWSVLVLESRSVPGGACWSEALTLPGYLHDIGAAFFPFGEHSPAFRALDLAGAGLRFVNAPYDSCHPGSDGAGPSLSRDLDRCERSLGVDGPRWRQLGEWQRQMGSRLVEAILGPLPDLRAAWDLGLGNLFHLARFARHSTASFSESRFETDAARRIIPGLALHADIGPDDVAGLGLGLVLALLACDAGFPVPIGGARAITDALVRRFAEAGGKLRLNCRAIGIVVRRGRAVAVRTVEGDEVGVRHAVLADVGPKALYHQLLPPFDRTWGIAPRMRRFRYAWGTFKVDWALHGPVPWTSEEARSAAVVHAGDSLDDLRRFTTEVRAGRMPEHPYLVIGQQSLVDPSRAPADGQTLWCYTHVPTRTAEEWERQKEAFADRIENRIEELAPGFRERIRGRKTTSPADLAAMNANLVGGDLGGGSAQMDQALFLRPSFPYFRHRTPVRGLYLASASTHPGAGVHGACGYNAARQALIDSERSPSFRVHAQVGSEIDSGVAEFAQNCGGPIGVLDVVEGDVADESLPDD